MAVEIKAAEPLVATSSSLASMVAREPMATLPSSSNTRRRDRANSSSSSSSSSS
eukprot:CAMPEP_0170474918 /NCGR_PEP_ID=MMETSP0123-20130129/16657_1 /TAXON_ID=182087 /ORGANISM="Favella ehrenbergii, Strain Fehren 1" /LENGTH=53 /DNA_ID=CAMNT_0010745085 /DNA_START=138 /DNA_END=296 /DNA_ORIENTATION=-